MIGIFDSGIGGLTVLRALLEKFPDQDFLYLGDTARLPYGSKSPETIRKYSEQNLEFLRSRNVDAIVVACNSASTQIAESSWQGVPLLTVIEPGAEMALQLSSSGKIAVLGTRATVKSKAYDQALLSLASTQNRKVEITSVACPLFVPLAEEGWFEDPLTNLVAYRYLQPMQAAGVDCAILGCTHYPLLRSAIQKSLGASVQLVDSGTAVAATLAKVIPAGKTTNSAKIKICLTDETPLYHSLCQDILSRPVNVEIVNI